MPASRSRLRTRHRAPGVSGRCVGRDGVETIEMAAEGLAALALVGSAVPASGVTTWVAPTPNAQFDYQLGRACTPPAGWNETHLDISTSAKRAALADIGGDLRWSGATATSPPRGSPGFVSEAC